VDIALKSEGMSGADLENITNESAYCCIHHSHTAITDEDLIEAFTKISKEKLAQYSSYWEGEIY